METIKTCKICALPIQRRRGENAKMYRFRQYHKECHLKMQKKAIQERFYKFNEGNIAKAG